MRKTRVVLAGVGGHGRWHLANLRRLASTGQVRLVGLCDPTPLGADELAPLGNPAQSPDLGALVDCTSAEVTVVAAPIHAHVDLALAAAAAGAHILLEKPPAPSYQQYGRLLTGLKRTRRVCQVGFQDLGSAAIPAVRRLIERGAVGSVRGIGIAGSWQRDSAYFTRAPWAGRRRLDGVAVADGVLTNPFAHAVAASLSIDGSEGPDAVRDVELELYRANPIESDDTSCLRLRTAKGTVITAAATLCGPTEAEPRLVVHGERGRIVVRYGRDEVSVERPNRPASVTRYRRTDLLENLLAHLGRGAELLAPLSQTAGFMRVLDAVMRAPDPTPIPTANQDIVTDNGVVRRVVQGIGTLVAESADRLALFSELSVPWSHAPWRYR